MARNFASLSAPFLLFASLLVAPPPDLPEFSDEK